MTTATSDPLIGRLIEGRYEVVSRIARGGMAMVYLATDNRLHRRVAIKVMHPHLAEDDEFRKRFEQEARSAARLTHPNLVSVLDQGEEDGVVYLVMEYLPGITLRELLKEQKFLTAEQTLEISEAVLSGLAAAHQAGIIHRDLKPENVILADDGRVKLADFGLARAASASTSTGQALLGTIAYLSPELVTRGTANKQSDVYAFGIMMYEMLTGEQPFTGDQPMQIAYQHAHDDVPAPSERSREATPEFDRIVRWATAKDPSERPADAGELLRSVQALLARPTPQQVTRVLATGDLTTKLLPDAVPAPQASPDAPDTVPPAPEIPLTPSQRAQARERTRARRGTTLLILTILLAVIAGMIGWWFGSGPGSLLPVPRLAEQSTEFAIAALDDLGLEHALSECHHLSIPPGHVVSTDPPAGSRVDRGATVTLCISTGPRILATPDVMGMSFDEAVEHIEAAGFVFGEVVSRQFTDADVDTVIGMLTAEGQPLPDELEEQGVINLVLSAGELPNLYDLSRDEAASVIEDVGLVLDDSLLISEYSDDVEVDRTLAIVIDTEPVSVGDQVGLRVSLGPELFEIPPVEGMTVREAMHALNDLGFDARAPWYLLDEALDSLQASGTNPAAGNLVPKGSRVDVTPKIF